MKLPKKIGKLMTITLVSTLLATSYASADSKDIQSSNLNGEGRWETAVNISQAGWSKSSEAIIVNEKSTTDVLVATPFAKSIDAPILLTNKNTLDSRTSDELSRLGVTKVYIIGGESALSKDIESQLASKGIGIDRIAGTDRYSTSVEIAKRMDSNKSVSEIVAINGEKGIADAVSVAPVAATKNMPILLIDPLSKESNVGDFINNKNIKTSYVIGGNKVVSEDMVKDLPNAKRISGKDRYETNVKVIQEFYSSSDMKNIYVTNDGSKNEDQLIDGLVAGVLASKNESPIMVVGSSLTQVQKDMVNSNKFDNVVKVGGNIQDSIVKEIVDLQGITTYEAKTVDELKDAVSKADANDVINFMPQNKIEEKITIESAHYITLNINGEFCDIVEINMPNGEVVNSGKIDTVIIQDVKVGTFTNLGTIKNIKIYDNNGSSIKNGKGGTIENIEIDSAASSITIHNSGTLVNIKNDSEGTKIINDGKITNKPTGSQGVVIENNGNTGGGSSGGGSTSPQPSQKNVLFDSVVLDGGSDNFSILSNKTKLEINDNSIENLEIEFNQESELIIEKIEMTPKVLENKVDVTKQVLERLNESNHRAKTSNNKIEFVANLEDEHESEWRVINNDGKIEIRTVDGSADIYPMIDSVEVTLSAKGVDGKTSDLTVVWNNTDANEEENENEDLSTVSKIDYSGFNRGVIFIEVDNTSKEKLHEEITVKNIYENECDIVVNDIYDVDKNIIPNQYEVIIDNRNIELDMIYTVSFADNYDISQVEDALTASWSIATISSMSKTETVGEIELRSQQPISLERTDFKVINDDTKEELGWTITFNMDQDIRDFVYTINIAGAEVDVDYMFEFNEYYEFSEGQELRFRWDNIEENVQLNEK